MCRHPENLSRFFVNNFYDSLLTDIYKYQNGGLIYVCGDFNSRGGDLDDFIRGVDEVCDREVIDFSLNKYGKILIDFFITTNMCLLKGRCSWKIPNTGSTIQVGMNGHYWYIVSVRHKPPPDICHPMKIGTRGHKTPKDISR